MESSGFQGVGQQKDKSQQPSNTEPQNNSTQNSPVAAPTIELPKGGGAIRGIGEKFGANPVTGTGSMSVPIATSPGRSGFGPQLALSYDSGSGNGPFGFGWSLGIPAITRKTDKGLPKYHDAEESDVFILSGAEDLVPVLAPGGNKFEDDSTVPDYIIHRYRPRIEGLFARIERWSHKSSGDVHWRSISNDNIQTIYGKDTNSRIADPEDPSRIFSWLLCETRDDKGNAAIYEYKPEDGVEVDLTQVSERNRGEMDDPRRTANRYLKHIRYGNRTSLLNELAHRPLFLSDLPDEQIANAGWMFEVVFDYSDHDANVPKPKDPGQWSFRKDSFSNYRAGFEVRTSRLCQRVLMFHHFADEEGVGDNCLVRSTDFTYSHQQDPDNSHNPSYTFLLAATQTGYKRKDEGYIKSSMPPVEFEYTKPIVQDRVEEVDSKSMENLPIGVDGAGYRWTDLHGEGIPGILTEQADGWFYKRNISPISDNSVDFTPIERVVSKPNLMMAGGAQLMDLASDGLPDLVMLDGPNPGLYEHDSEEGWQAFRPFTSRLNRSTQDPNTRFIDLTGDGHADVFITEDNAFVWHASMAEEGFGTARKVIQELDEEQGPRLVFADSTQSIYLSDLSGDGLTDLVRIRNGEICYWPNLGYARFGAKVTMDNAPHFDTPDQFDHQRIRLADIDGTGTTDIIFLHQDGVRLYFNQSGNGWSEPQVLKVFPRVDEFVSIMLTDLLGNGTACLVWSSSLPADANSPMRYVNLMGDQKPHLLVKTINNLGAETRMEYAPSTKFYLQDKRDGKPWVTKLPFPVHVVQKVIAIDHISKTRFSSEYTYHHGYFDRAEREFRGFGRVDQIDTETFEHFVKTDASNVVEEDLHEPPVLTRTWFHTGAFIDRERILSQFAHEYYQNGALTEYQLPEAPIPEGLNTVEWREALRACKGIALRSEVYALDGSDKSSHPYAVTQNNCAVKHIQPLANNKHAVFLSLPSESISYHYERNPADPRISHSLTLETDEFGNVLKAAEVVYPRQLIDDSLPDAVQEEHAKRHIIYSETDFTNDIDMAAPQASYRLRQAFESRAYELTGVAPANGHFFNISEQHTAATTAVEIAYETIADNSLQKRLIEQSRNYFLKDDLSGPLPLGKIDPLGLGHEAYQIAFTPELVTHIYDAKVNNALLEEAAYVHCKNINQELDDNWWIPSGTTIYPENASEHFYLAIGVRDPFGNASRIDYDKHELLVNKTSDALQNEVTAEHDYRLLQPTLVTDPNRNQIAVETDVLGMVITTAVMGKEGENVGDTLADPTTRLEYKLDNWQKNQQPNFSHSFAREKHGANNPRDHETISYSDGGGNGIMVKVQAEPGLAKKVESGVVTEIDTSPDIRWIGNGRTVINNKGKPVKQYEPYFSTTSEFENNPKLVELGVTPILKYDAMGRLIRTDMPDGTFAKVVFDAWQSSSFDANDTVLESEWFVKRTVDDPVFKEELIKAGKDPIKEKTAAEKAAKHANTPATQHTDSLARPILTIEHNKNTETEADEFYHTSIQLDIEGNTQSITDARNNKVMQYRYDMLGNQVYQDSMDAGQRWSLVNVAGNPIRSWDERNHELQKFYDALQRPTISKVLGGDIEGTTLNNIISRVFYGESETNPEEDNTRGQVVKLYDTGGVIESPKYDFKGQPIFTRHRLFKNYKSIVNWEDENLETDLETEKFVFTTEIDALGRITKQTAPDKSIITPSYNPAGGLLNGESVKHINPTKETTYINDIDYNEKGQRESITYGNNVKTIYKYDEETFRLKQLITKRSNKDVLQDLHYTYDPVGNITDIEDKVSPVVFYKQQATSSVSTYTYDAIYRLQQAIGRENITPPVFNGNDNWNDLKALQQLSPNGDMAIQNYKQFYAYDAVGNIEQTKHEAVGNEWTRKYEYQTENNRLISTKIGDLPENTYTYDHHEKHGYITKMPHLEDMGWNFKEELVRTTRQRTVNESITAETTYYQYDGEGQRIRKITENAATAGNEPTLKEERIYIAGYEVFRQHSGNKKGLIRQTLSLMDEEHRFVMVETRNDVVDDGTEIRLVRYQHHNHLGSASLEIEGSDEAKVISYEEYHPYGTTAYQVKNSDVRATAKRYRYTGMERDEESGFSYHSARYYLPWLGRWLSSDPIGVGVGDGVNLYGYVRGNPVRLVDVDGKQANYDERSRLTRSQWYKMRNGYGISGCLESCYLSVRRSIGGKDEDLKLRRKVFDEHVSKAMVELLKENNEFFSGFTGEAREKIIEEVTRKVRQTSRDERKEIVVEGKKKTDPEYEFLYKKTKFRFKDFKSADTLLEVGHREGYFGSIFRVNVPKKKNVKDDFINALIQDRVDPTKEGYYMFVLSIKNAQHTGALFISVDKNKKGTLRTKVYFFDQLREAKDKDKPVKPLKTSETGFMWMTKGGTEYMAAPFLTQEPSASELAQEQDDYIIEEMQFTTEEMMNF